MADTTAPQITFGQATQNLADSLDKIQGNLADQINNLANSIDELAGNSATSAADLAGGATSLPDGVTDGSVVVLQYKINNMEKAAEDGASTFTKAENISKEVFKNLCG